MSDQLPGNFNNENEVQFYYSTILCKILKCTFSARFKTDGIYDSQYKKLKILAEYKHSGNLKDIRFLSKCLIQILCYIKKIENSGEILPKLIFVGNKDNFILFESILLSEYLEFVDHQMVPSNMFSNPPESLLDLLATKFKTYIYSITDLNRLENLIDNYKNTTGLKMTIDNNNIITIFEDFITSNIIEDKLKDHEAVNLFASIIFGECNDIVGKPNLILTPLTEKQVVKINRDNYDAFLSIIKSIDKPSEKNKIISQSDRLIEEVFRRFHGEFYTPRFWTNEAHKLIVNQFGPTCYTDYVWWDPCSGLGNLTRNCEQFGELYCSTLFQSDIDIMNRRNYNSKAVKFQYDFLNDDVTPEDVIRFEEEKLKKLAPGLVKALEENKPIIIFMNPPYAVAADYFEKNKTKKDITDTKINLSMKGMSLARQNLYTQFLFRIIYMIKKFKLTNLNVCFFSPITFLTKPSYENFRKVYLKMFEYKDSFLMKSSFFSDTTGIWPILFSCWTSGITTRKIYTNVLDKDNDNYTKLITKKRIYSSVAEIKSWSKIKPFTVEVPVLSNPINVKNETYLGFREDTISYLTFDSSDIGSAQKGNGIHSSVLKRGYPIEKENFYKCISIYVARHLAIPRWFNLHDEFLVPDYKHKEYFQWNIDCIAVSIFSNQSSLRNILCKKKFWNIKNQFFWLPNEMMKQLADDNGFDEMYQDAHVFSQDSFVYNELQKVYPQLSQDAKDVLEKANDLVIKTIVKRKELHNLHPEWHLHAWDAGWYQIKLVLKESFKEDLSEFVSLYKKFEDRMREGVYKFGFLK